MLLEEEVGQFISEGRVHYHADNMTVRVPLDANARESVLQSISRARELRISEDRPPSTSNDRLCLCFSSDFPGKFFHKIGLLLPSKASLYS